MMRIGFCGEEYENNAPAAPNAAIVRTNAPRPSVVQVLFPDGRSLAYYNDLFDLRPGDLVFVDGKLAGIRGQVTKVSCNFKIRRSDYQRVIAAADREVHGKFIGIGSYFLTDDSEALPPRKVRGWFLPPAQEEDFVCGSDGTAIPLNDLSGLEISPKIAERGHGYYRENRVVYLSVTKGHGYAIVEGSSPYEVEFEFDNGQISGLTCSCWCSGTCKHEFAVLLLLHELMEKLETFSDRPGSFSAIEKATLFRFAVDSDRPTEFTL